MIIDLWIEENAKYFTTIGFFIYSFDKDTLIKQGRHNNQKYLSKECFEKICEKSLRLYIKNHNFVNEIV